MARAPKTPGRPKKKAAPAQPAAKKPVPDVLPNVHANDRTIDENSEIIDDCFTAVREHRTAAMGVRALLWMSNVVSTMMLFIVLFAGHDEIKLAQIAKLTKNLLAGGWTSQISAGFGLVEWTFLGGESMTSTKAEKAIKPAKAVAKMFLALCTDAFDLAGGVGDDEDDADPPTTSPPRGTHEDDSLYFDPADFENDPGNVPDFMKNVTPRNLRDDPALDERARAFSQGLRQPANHRQASGDLGFDPKLGCPSTDFQEARVLQEDPITRHVISVKVGAPKTAIGLLKLYTKQLNRLAKTGHIQLEDLRFYVNWMMEVLVEHRENDAAVEAFFDHDKETRENWLMEGFFFNVGHLNASWSKTLSTLALTTATTNTNPYQRGQKVGGGRGGGGGGGGRGNANRVARGRAPARGNGRVGNQGRGGGGNAPCHDFLAGKCTRQVCKFKH